MPQLVYNTGAKQIPKDAHLMIIGAMKCGTTALYTALIQHPRICPCITKEPEYFSETQSHGIRAIQGDELWATSRTYADLWNFRPGKHAFAIEASTGYTKYPMEQNPARNIKNYGLEPHFIYMVRDPYRRIESMYNYMVAMPPFDAKESLTDTYYVALSSYFFQLEHYRELFGTGRLMIIDFDDWIADRDAVLARVCRFLGLEDFTVDEELIDRYETSHTQLEVRLHTSRILRALVPGKKQRYRLGLALSRFSGPAVKRRLTADERAAIHDLLKKDMKEFKRVYGFPVEKWGF
jgi:hypothetical protein